MKGGRRAVVVLLLGAVVVSLFTSAEPRRARVVLAIDLGARFVDGPLTDAAVRRVAGVLGREMGLPVPEKFTIYLYDSAALFEQGLMFDAAVTPGVAAELAGFAAGVSVPRAFLLRTVGPGWLERPETIRLIAHELTHLVQLDLAGGEGRGAQWLAEGMAEWVALMAVERLGLAPTGGLRDAALTSLRARVAARPQLDLAGLTAPRDFLVRHRREGTLATYQMALALVDYLVARHGMPSLVAYFRAFRNSADEALNFRTAFGQDMAAFERESLRRLGRRI